MIDIDSQVRAIAGNLYDGAFWQNKNNPDSNLYKFLRAYAISIIYYKSYYSENIKELIIPKVEKYIAEYEQLLGIPDDIFTTVSPVLSERINIVLIKLLGFLCVTKEEIVNLIKIAYPTITNIQVINSNNFGTFGSLFPFPFYANPYQSTNNINYVITGVFDADLVKKILESIHSFQVKINVTQI